MTAGQKGPLHDTMGTLVISPQGVLGDTYPDVSGRRKGGDYRRRYITALRSRIIQKTSQFDSTYRVLRTIPQSTLWDPGPLDLISRLTRNMVAIA